jgi:hypothetical protein
LTVADGVFAVRADALEDDEGMETGPRIGHGNGTPLKAA